jgi:hypothetical protein
MKTLDDIERGLLEAPAKHRFGVDPSISTALPCRIAIFATGSGNMLSTIRPTEMIRGLLILLIAYLLGFPLKVTTGAGFAPRRRRRRCCAGVCGAMPA